MFKRDVTHCLVFTLFLAVVSLLSAAEVRVVKFYGQRGHYLAIPDLKVGPVHDLNLAARGIQINLLKVDHQSGEVMLEYQGKEVDHFALMFPAHAQSSVQIKPDVIHPWWGKTKVRFSASKGLPSDAGLKVYLRTDEERREEPATCQLALIGGDTQEITSWKIDVETATDNLGNPIGTQKWGWTRRRGRVLWTEGDQTSQMGTFKPFRYLCAFLTFDALPLNATHLAKVDGRMLLRKETFRRVLVRPVVSNAVQHPLLSDFSISLHVDKVDVVNGVVQVRYVDPLDRIDAINVYPLQEKCLKQEHSSGDGWTIVEITTAESLPPEVQLVIDVIDQRKESSVPFTLENLKLG